MSSLYYGITRCATQTLFSINHVFTPLSLNAGCEMGMDSILSESIWKRLMSSCSRALVEGTLCCTTLVSSDSCSILSFDITSQVWFFL